MKHSNLATIKKINYWFPPCKKHVYLLFLLFLVLPFKDYGQSFGNAFNFDGTNDYLEVNSTTNFNLSNTTLMTIEMWIKLNGNNSGFRGLIAKGGAEPFYQLAIHNNRFTVQLALNSTTSQTFFIDQDLNDGKWHHVAFAVNRNVPARVRLFLDGRRMINSEASILSNDLLNNVKLVIGTERGKSIFFNGSIDEIRIWNIERTEAQIRDNRNQLISASTPNLSAVFRFEEGIANGNNAILSNTLAYQGSLAGTASIINASLNGSTSNFVPSYAATEPIIESIINTCSNYTTLELSTPSSGTGQALRLEYSTTADFTSSQSIILNPIDTFIVIGNLLPQTRYFARALSFQTNRLDSSIFSSSFEFTTTINNSILSTLPSTLYLGASYNLTTASNISFFPAGMVSYESATGNLQAVQSGAVWITETSNLSGCFNTFSQRHILTHTPGRALQMNHVNSNHVIVPNHTSINFGGGLNFTIECWFMTTDTRTNFEGLVTKGGATDNHYQLAISQNKLIGELRSSSSVVFFSGNTNINDGKWHHAALVVNKTANNAQLYLDGKIEASAAASTAITGTHGNTSPLRIGVDREANNFFNGYIDEVRIWSEPRTLAQLLNNMEDTVARNSSNLAAYFRFDNGAGNLGDSLSNQLIDLSVNQNHGTLSGFNLRNASPWVTSVAMVKIKNLYSSQVCNGQFTLNWDAIKHGIGLNLTLEASTSRNFINFINSYSQQPLSSRNSPVTLNYLESSPNIFVRLKFSSNDNSGESIFSDTIQINNEGAAAIIGNTHISLAQTMQLNHDSIGGTWASSVPAIATIDAAGQLTAVSPGQTTITYTFSRGTCVYIASKRINVRHPQGNALAFLASKSTYITGTLSTLPIGSQQRSISFYVKPDNLLRNGTCFVYGSNSLNKDFLSIGLVNGKIRIIANAFTLVSKTVLLPNQWNHITVTVGGGSPALVSLYINFALDISQNAVMNTLGTQFVIGSNLSLEPSEFISGELDELKIWSKSLTETEINESRYSDVVAQSSLLAHYDFNNGTALANNLFDTTLFNIVGFVGNGTLRNFNLQNSITNYTLSYALPGAIVTSVSNICFNNALLNITPYNANLITNYLYEISETSDFLTFETSEMNTLSNTLELTNLQAGKTYYVRVRAKNNILNISAAPSPLVSFNTLGGLSAINIPSIVYKGQTFTANVIGFSGTWAISNPAIGSINTNTGQYIASDTGVQTISLNYSTTGCAGSIHRTFYANNIPGSAFNFSGTSNQILQAPHINNLNIGIGSLTLELWFQTNDNSTAFMGMVSKGSTGAMYQIAKQNNRLTAEIRTSSGAFISLQSSTTINDGKWHHAALIISRGTSNTATLFLNGIVVASSTPSQSSNLGLNIDNNIPLKIGVEREGNIFFVGKLDEIRLWKTARSVEALRQFMFDTVATNAEHLAAYYRFDEGMPERDNSFNRVLTDLSVNQNHANFQSTFALNGSTDNYVLSMAMVIAQNLSNKENCGNRLVVSYEAPKYGYATSCIFELVTDTTNMATAVSPFSGSIIRLNQQIELTNLNRNQAYYWRPRPFHNTNGEVARTPWMTTNTITCNSVWTGAQNNEWNNPLNWASSATPKPLSFISIPFTSNQPQITGEQLIDSLIIEAGAIVSLSPAQSDTLTLQLGISGNGNLKGHTNASLQLLRSRTNYSIRFLQTSTESDNTLRNLIINNTARTITLANPLILGNRLTMTAGNLQTSSGNLILKATANSTASVGTYNETSASILGTVRVEIYVPGRRAFRFISHPFAGSISFDQVKNSIFITGNGGSANGFDPTASNNPSLLFYNPMQGNINIPNDTGWRAITNLNTQVFEPNRGYRILVRGSRSQSGTLSGSNETPKDTVISLIGTLSEGSTKTINLTGTLYSQFNLIGNPFAAPIDLSKVTFTNCKPNLFFFDPWRGTRGAFYASNSTDASIIPAGSAFFVEKNTLAPASISFPTSIKTFDGSSKILLKTNEEKIHLQILSKDNVIWDEFALVNGTDKNGSFENNDARKLINPEINLFSKSLQTTPLSIDVRNIESVNLPLFLTSTTNGDFILDFSKSNIPQGKTYWLNHNNTSTEITQTLKYNLKIVNRTDTVQPIFYISTDRATAVTENGVKPSIKAPYPNPFENEVYIDEQLLALSISEIYITDIMGRIIKRFEPNKFDNKLQVENLSSGLYLLNINYSEGKISYKLLKN